MRIADIATTALIDTGSQSCLVNYDALNSRNLRSFPRLHTPKLVSASGHEINVVGCYKLPIQVGHTRIPHPVVIVRGLNKPAIIGYDFLQKYRIHINHEKGAVVMGTQVIPLLDSPSERRLIVNMVNTVRLAPFSMSRVAVSALGARQPTTAYFRFLPNAPAVGDSTGIRVSDGLIAIGRQKTPVICVENRSEHAYTFKKGAAIGTAECLPMSEYNVREMLADAHRSEVSAVTVNRCAGPEPVPQQTLTELLNEYKDVFSQHEHDIGRTDLLSMTINTGDAKPIFQRPYRVPYSQRQVIDTHVREMLDAGVIQPSVSPWASPVVLVPKKEGTLRFCVDYRKINAVTVRDVYPLPHIQDVLSSMAGCRYFTTLDLRAGYWQIEVAPEDRQKTAFTTYRGHWEFKVVPFGLVNSPALFQRLMNIVLDGLHHKCAIAYIDDIVIFSRTLEEHYGHLREVFERLRQAGLKLKPSKCEFERSKINYLGHVISSEGVQPDPSKVIAVQNISKPSTVTDIRSFLGLTGYYRQHIKDYAKIAQPLTALTRSHSRFLWTEEHQQAFEKLKQCLITAPILAYPRPGVPYRLYTDASEYACGAVLSQVDENGKERVVQYLSKQYNESQMKWSCIEREAYAMVYAVQKLRHYLVGQKFTIVTDHRPLKWLMEGECKNAKVQRWALTLQECDCDVEYRPGLKHRNADTMSRIRAPLVPDDSSEEDALGVYNVEAAQPVSMDEMRRQQQGDEEIQGVVKCVTEHKCESESCGCTEKLYTFEDGILYRNDNDQYERMVVPTPLVETLIERVHNNGHLGIAKTLSVIKPRYFWPGMRRDVERYCSKCVPCTSRKGTREAAPMGDTPVPHYPFQTISLDTQGPFPATKSGHKYIVTVLDMFSGWPECFPVKDKTAETIAAVLTSEVIPRWGVPEVMLTDNGTEYVNQVMTGLAINLGIVHVKTTPYNPKANGKNERFHRTLNNMIACYTTGDWDERIPAALMAYRSSVHSTSGLTPFYLTHGFEPTIPVETFLRPRRKTYNPEDHVAVTASKLHHAYSQMKKATELSRQHNRERYNRRAKEMAYEPGDPVYYYTEQAAGSGDARKLRNKWRPYYHIVQKVSPYRYVIRRQGTDEVKTAYVEHLKPAHRESEWDAPPPAPEAEKLSEQGREGASEPTLECRPPRGEAAPTRIQPHREAKLDSSAREPEPEAVDMSNDEWDSEDNVPLEELHRSHKRAAEGPAEAERRPKCMRTECIDMCLCGAKFS